ncbi:hypothetical protein M3I54_35980 [Paraburkholderia sp. CNPSo 3274]|uniref:hypothetical protein n=1 Tax=unclassified Paraburkholderia TaxID=2615204 RepID=UPI0020B80245|nr:MULTISPECIES: hypothetical protein [unclassified Paraburkholderia]MCP3712282.1 hypothetical protein [Paraburkholderia sp. CNPSo 3274]MCP3718490.1 hypothetical protein [Paraburkholderia sp. CNPSo 3281]
MNDTIQTEGSDGRKFAHQRNHGDGSVAHVGTIAPATTAQPDETCKCRRLGDWRGFHHPLCDKAYEDEAAAPAQIALLHANEATLEADAVCECTPKPSRQRAARLLATIAAARLDLLKLPPSNERTGVSIALDDAELLAREVIDNPVPDSVRAALERMCTPLDKSWLSGATAQADAHCMKVIRGYVLGSKTSGG